MYVLEEFPSNSEYFILNEINELSGRGFVIRVLAMRKNKRVTVELADPAKVLYRRSYVAILGIAAHVYLLRTERVRYLRMVRALLFNRGRSFMLILKQLKVFFTAAYFLHRLRGMAVAHIHAHFCSVPTDLAICMSELSGIGFSCSAHARDIYTGRRNDLKEKIEKARFLVTCTAYNSTYFRELAGKANGEKIFHVYHGIDMTAWPAKRTREALFSSKSIRILTVCRLVPKKGVLYLLEAIKMLRDGGVRVECSIIGDGPLRREIERYRELSGLQDNIRLYGIVAQDVVRSFYMSSDVFVLASTVAEDGDRDGLPNVLVESLAVGLPVVTTAVSGIPELVVPDVTGILVPDRSPGCIRDAILRLMGDRELYVRIAGNGRRKAAEEFSIHHSTDKLIEILGANGQKN